MRKLWPITALLVLGLAASPVRAQDWLELETDRFNVISQLSESNTLQWAEEFGRFILSARDLAAARSLRVRLSG